MELSLQSKVQQFLLNARTVAKPSKKPKSDAAKQARLMKQKEAMVFL